ncbi:MAG: sulfatase-like hydrolase/transferase [Oscillospiraceae bacterium]|nr:sulfatase-like hydrolase/transferase [Oscillospiraceae bacterium]
MEWEFDQTVQQSAEQSTEQSTEQSQVRRRTQRRRSGPLPPWVLVFGCLLFYAFFFHIWTEDRFSLGRFLTLTVLSLAFAMLSALLGTISKRRKYQKIFALAVVIFWGVMYLTEYFILDSFHNFYTIEGMLTGAGNAGQEDFKDRTVDLVLSNFWRILLFALPIVGWFVANRFLKIRRILTRGVRRYLAVAGAVLLVVGLIFASALSPDRNRMGKEYNFTDAVHGFGLPMGFTLDLFKGGGSSEFELPDDSFVPTDPPAISSDPSGIESQSVQTDTNGETLEPIPTEPPKPTYTYQMLDLDFQSLIDNSGDDTVVNLSKYLSSRTPSMTNEMTGMFRGKNLILITCEAFSKEFIDPELTPTLYRMMTKGIQFTDYYQPAWGGSTSSGEFSVLTGIYPGRGVKSITNTIGRNMDITIGNLLQDQGYFTRAYHNHTYTYYDRDKTHENLGYEEFIGVGNGMEVTKAWPESDLEMIDFTAPQYIDHQPFSVYYITVSGHGAYSWGGNRQSARHKEEVQNLNCSDTVKAYIACNLEVELAMKSLIEQLEAAGIADDTLIVLTADHYPYCLEKSDAWYTDKDYLSEYYGETVTNVFQRDHNCLIMWSGCLEDMNLVIDSPTFSLDIVPTLCNLFGVEWDSRLYSGRDVFSDAEPLVFWPDHSWKTDKGSWNASLNNGKEFTPAPGAEVTDEYLNRIRSTVSNKLNYGYTVLGLDYFKYLFQ